MYRAAIVFLLIGSIYNMCLPLLDCQRASGDPEWYG